MSLAGRGDLGTRRSAHLGAFTKASKTAGAPPLQHAGATEAETALHRRAAGGRHAYGCLASSSKQAGVLCRLGARALETAKARQAQRRTCVLCCLQPRSAASRTPTHGAPSRLLNRSGGSLLGCCQDGGMGDDTSASLCLRTQAARPQIDTPSPNHSLIIWVGLQDCQMALREKTSFMPPASVNPQKPSTR